MGDPFQPQKDVVMLGQLPDDDFETSVNRARDAMRARIGLPPEAPRPTPTSTTVRMPAQPSFAIPPAAPQAAPVADFPPVVHEQIKLAPLPAAPPVVAAAREIHHAPAARPRGVRVSVPVLGGCLLVLAAAGAGILYFQFPGALSAAPAPPAATTGAVEIISQPAGATILVDGVTRGVAPLNLTLPIGPHTLQLVSGTTKRSLPLSIEAGTIVKQYVDFAAGATAFGRIEVTSEPAGAEVTVDGVVRGTTPVLLADIPPGPHTITIGQGDTLVTRAVEVTAGSTSSVVASTAPATGSAGWVALKSPLPLEIREDGRVVAAAGVDRVMLPIGRHELEVTSAEFEFRTTLTVHVQAGRTTNASVALPNGTLSINAVPWAEVQLDGKPMGTTPLGNLQVPIGTHEIVFTHPQLGERRQTVKVKAQTPVRAGMDFGK